MNSLEIEEKTQVIIKKIGDLYKHIDSQETYMHKLGNSLSTTVSHFNNAHKELKKIDKDVVRIAGTTPVVEPATLDRPSTEI